MRGATAGKIAAVLVTILITVIGFAPAAWLGDVLQSRSPVRLVNAAGTIWQGSAMVALSDGQQSRLVPGRVSWRVLWPELLSGRVVLSVRHPIAADPPLTIGFDGHALRLGAGAARVPAALLSVLGAPFNTVRPGGTLQVRWDTLTIGPDAFEGGVQIDWQDAQSALSPIAPLGNFRLTALGRGAYSEAKLTTLKGPLLIEGAGSLERGRMRFTATAGAQPDMQASLNGLIAVLGRKTGDRAVLNWDLRK
jgi:general secretion pathway protein N